MRHDQDYFETYLDYFPDAPSLVLVRSVELKNFPMEFIKRPILDLCCGDGFFSKCLGLNNIYGLDLNSSAIEKAQETGIYIETKVCDARDLSVFNIESFYTVISNCALEHIDGIDEALVNISRVLKLEGCLIMSVPSDNLNNWYMPKIIFEKMRLHKYGKYLLEKYNKRQTHLNLYSLSCWKIKFKKAGLKIVKSFYLFNEKHYKIATVLDSLGGPILSKVYLVFRMIIPLTFRKLLWRRILKQIYLDSGPLDFGGELIIVAQKNEK